MKKLCLSELSAGQAARVCEMHVEGTLRRRLFDLGLIPGTVVFCRGKAPCGSPIAFYLRGAVIALRKRDAANIFAEVSA